MSLYRMRPGPVRLYTSPPPHTGATYLVVVLVVVVDDAFAAFFGDAAAPAAASPSTVPLVLHCGRKGASAACSGAHTRTRHRLATQRSRQNKPIQIIITTTAFLGRTSDHFR